MANFIPHNFIIIIINAMQFRLRCPKGTGHTHISYPQNVVDRVEGWRRGDRLSNDAWVIWIREVSWPPVKQQHPLIIRLPTRILLRRIIPDKAEAAAPLIILALQYCIYIYDNTRILPQ